MKKLLLFFVVMLLPMSASSFTGEAEIDGIKYYIITKGQTAEVRHKKYSGDIAIPSSIEYEGVNCNVVSIGEKAFYECSELTSVTIPNSVTSIGSYAFSGCKKLSNIAIPVGVTSIGSSAFSCCYRLTSIEVESGNTMYDSRNNCNAIIETASNTLVFGCKNTVIPNSVTRIGSYAFDGCSGLISVTIPNSVTSIGSYAFYDCTGLTSITIPNSVTSIGSYAFDGCSGLISVTIGNSVTYIGNNAFSGCSGLKRVIVSDIAAWCGIQFGEHAGDPAANPLFYAHHLYSDENTEIQDLVIPNSVTSIGYYAFENCFGLTSVIIPNSVKSIRDCAFRNCDGLTSVTIPNSVTSIGSNAFYHCSGLTSVTIGNGIKNIYNKAFGICPNLTDVTCYAKNVPSTKSDAFNESYIEFTTLHVPSSSVNAYKNVEPWKKFKEIVEIDIPKHKLIYIVDDDIYKTLDIEEGEAITPEPVPTKEGYTFSGWSEIPETMPDHDVTVTGTFTVNKYKLVYMVNGVEYKSYEVEYGAAITPEKEPTKEGYSFSGWSEIPETMPSNDVIIKGNFTINKYKLIYMVDGEVYKSFDVTYGTKIYPEAEPQKEGYAFSGWSEIPETMPSHDVTVTGTFTLLQKCGKPVIYYEKGRLTFTCDTEGVEYVTEITNSDIKKHYESEITLTATYNISVYAKKDGFAISDVSTATLCWIDAEPKTEGVTNDVVNVPARAVLIQTDGGSINVQGADDGTQVRVYNVNGSQVGSAISQNGVVTINTTLQSGSVAIVKVDKKSVKILLK